MPSALCSLLCPPWDKMVAKVRRASSGPLAGQKGTGVQIPGVITFHKWKVLHQNPSQPQAGGGHKVTHGQQRNRAENRVKARRKDKDLPPSNQDEHKLYLEQDVLERRIPDSDLRQLVELPSGLDYNEWLASHTLAFFEHINLIYGTISEFCTMSGCPDMVGPCQRQYQWYDEKGKKCKVAAPQYTDYVMTFTQKTINDECIFPSKFGNEFPTSFESIVKKIHRLLFHVVAHLYCAHFKEIWMLALHTHLNCLFAHMVLFNERFKLIEDKETEILNDLVIALKLHSDTSATEVPTENDGSGNGGQSSVCDTTDETMTVDKTVLSSSEKDVMRMTMMMMGGARFERDDDDDEEEEEKRPDDVLATPDLVLTTGVDIKLQQ